MKKINSIIFIVLVLLNIFVACGKEDVDVPMLDDYEFVENMIETEKVFLTADFVATCTNTVIADVEIILDRGVCYGVTSNPTIEDNRVSEGKKGGTLETMLKNLRPNTTYYVRAYVTTVSGTYYANELTFSTPKIEKPTLVTKSVTGISANRAICGGIIESNGWSEITECGVCWSTSSLPTIDDNKTLDAIVDGGFRSNILGLTENVTYYVRAYAINEKGVGYGDVMHFTPSGQPINGHSWVDLMLPSGLKWATCNEGAGSPEEMGNYYAWGEITTKSEYTQQNSVTYDRPIATITADGEYDVARANWGSTWRMPNKEDVIELIENCTWTWIMQNNVYGYKVEGANGNSIFLPAVGYYSDALHYSLGNSGNYWSGTSRECDDENAYCFYFDNTNYSIGWTKRNLGFTVRPVSE